MRKSFARVIKACIVCQYSDFPRKIAFLQRNSNKIAMARLLKRSLLILAPFILLLFVSNLLLYQIPSARRQQYQLATDTVLNTLNQIGNAETSVLPNQSTVILEPSSVFPCPGNSGSGLFVLVMVISAPDNVARREQIRSVFNEMQPRWEEMFRSEKMKSDQSHLNVTYVFQVLFFVGQSAGGGISDKVREEWERNGDIVIDDLVESYLNLTVKTMRMLKWVLTNCAHSNFLIKMDDDVFLHIPKLLSFLLSQSENSRLVAGHRYDKVSVDRNPHSKWFTPVAAYFPEKYPPFVGGFCYVLGMKAAQEIFEEGVTQPLFHLEDVFLTGLVASRNLNYELHDPGKILTMMLWFHNLRPLSFTQEFVIIHEISPAQFRCWTRLTGTEQLGWTSSVWPLFLSCFE